MTKPRIIADFNNCDELYRVRLNTIGSMNDIAKLSVPLQQGTIATLVDGEGEFEVDATVSSVDSLWVATPIWETRRAVAARAREGVDHG